MNKHLAIKVTNKYESEAVQKELISLGYRWLSNDNNTLDLSNELPVVILCTPLSVLAWRKFSLDMMKEDILIISSSDFFSTYAGHIERFPDYVPRTIIMDDPCYATYPNISKKVETKEDKSTRDILKDKNLVIRTDNEEQFNAVQNKLSSLGFRWRCGESEIKYHSNFKQIFFSDDLMSYCEHYTNDCNFKGYCQVKCKLSQQLTTQEFIDKYFPEPKLNLKEIFERDYPELLQGEDPVTVKFREILDKKCGRKQEPKFKVGDYVYIVTKKSIKTGKIERKSDSFPTIFYYIDPVTLNSYCLDINSVDISESYHYSTPELAAKRFLELNK